MSYRKVEFVNREIVSVDINNEGALTLTALVADPNDTFNLDIGPFYHTFVYYGYGLDEAIDNYIYHTINDLQYVFVEEDEFQ